MAFRYRLDPAEAPRRIDLVDEGNKGARPSPGIYRLQGDELTLCWDAAGESRPTEFTAAGRGGQDLRLMVLKRE